MEYYKKYGKTSWAKHLRNKKGAFTKPMANKKSRAKSKIDLNQDIEDICKERSLMNVSNSFDHTEWNW
jgi:hypothetical protein